MSKPDTLDLAALDTAALCEQGAELELVHPGTGAPLGVWITMAGIDSRIWRGAVAAQTWSRRGRRDLTPDEIQAGAVDILARCTLGWRGVVLEGKELPCTMENARMLYSRLPWVREQVDRFASDRASYLRD